MKTNKKINFKDMTWNKLSNLTWANSQSTWPKLWGRNNFIEKKAKKNNETQFFKFKSKVWVKKQYDLKEKQLLYNMHSP